MWSILICALPTLTHISLPSLTNFYNYLVISHTTKDSHFHVVTRFVIQISREKLSFACSLPLPNPFIKSGAFHGSPSKQECASGNPEIAMFGRRRGINFEQWCLIQPTGSIIRSRWGPNKEGGGKLPCKHFLKGCATRWIGFHTQIFPFCFVEFRIRWNKKGEWQVF